MKSRFEKGQVTNSAGSITVVPGGPVEMLWLELKAMEAERDGWQEAHKVERAAHTESLKTIQKEVRLLAAGVGHD